MATQTPGILAEVPLREVWVHEARDFTPWLLTHAESLGSELGMDLELTSAEHAVGGFSLDLIGSDRFTGESVILENQLETTDHAHLGQLLTYAAGTDAVNVVWIAADFRSEHRAALDWLNQRTDVHTRFFGVQLSAVRIDGSRPAPRFRLVAQPNDWGKQLRTRAQAQDGDRSERGLPYHEFWQQFRDRIRQDHPSWSRGSSAPQQNWFPMAAGMTGVSYTCSFTRRGLQSELTLQDSDPAINEARFDALLGQRDQLETSYGGPLLFERLDGRKSCRVADVLDDGVFDSTDRWSEYVEWFANSQERLRAAVDSIGGVPRLD